MEFVSSSDYFEVRLGSQISDLDKDTIVGLYQPIIGYKAAMVYFTMLRIGKNRVNNGLQSHEVIFTYMQITPGDFLAAKNNLEAVGLIETFFKEEGAFRCFVYVLISPKTPEAFFDDILFKGLLVKYIGEKEASILASKYNYDAHVEGLNNISSHFASVFNVDLNSDVFKASIKAKSRNSAKVQITFDFVKFFEQIKIDGMLNKDFFSKNQLQQIANTANLFGFDEISMSDIVLKCVNMAQEKEKRIDFDKLYELAKEEAKYPFLIKGNAQKIQNSKVASEEDKAQLVNLMNEVSPVEYLKFVSGATAPAGSDIRLIEDLSNKFKLPNPVINALLSYVLQKLDNVLSRPFTEKIAASLARSSITTAIDAVNYLSKTDNRYSKEKSKTVIKPVENVIIDKENTTDDEEFKKALEEIEKLRKENG